MLGEHPSKDSATAESTANGAKQSQAKALKVDGLIYDEIADYAKGHSPQPDGTEMTIRDAARVIFFQKLAALPDNKSLTENDENLKPFQLAIKHL